MERWGVSGQSGFIGSHLVEKLKQTGQDVVPISRSGFVPSKIDRIVDLASFGNIYSQTDVLEIYRANVIRFIEVMEHARRIEGIKSIVATSSSSVELPVQTLYSASKKAMEEVAQIYAKEHGLPVIIVRPFSVYGPGEQKEHLIPKLIDSCLHGTEMPFVGEPKHDFIYIDDFIEELLRVAKTGEKGNLFITGLPILPVGTGISTTNEEVKDIVEKVTGKKANIKRVESLREYDSKKWKSAISPLKCISLEEGIRRMVNGK